MEPEYEAKFYPIDKKEFREKLISVGADLVVKERKMRRSIVDSRNNPQFDCHYIRVRDEGDRVTMSAKVHARVDGDIRDQKETVVTVSDYDDTVKLLQLMGFEIDTYQETLRETWEMNGAEVVIDTWPGLDTYVEIEAESIQKVKNVANKLELDWNSKIVTSVVEVYGKIYGLTNEEVHKKISNLTFEKNPFDDMKKKSKI